MKEKIERGDVVEYEKATGEIVRAKVLRRETACLVKGGKNNNVRLVSLRRLKLIQKGDKNVEVHTETR